MLSVRTLTSIKCPFEARVDMLSCLVAHFAMCSSGRLAAIVLSTRVTFSGQVAAESTSCDCTTDVLPRAVHTARRYGAEQKAHAEAVAQVYALQTEGVSKAEDQAMVGEMTALLRDATRERDELAMRSEDLARQLSGACPCQRLPQKTLPPMRGVYHSNTDNSAS